MLLPDFNKKNILKNQLETMTTMHETFKKYRQEVSRKKDETSKLTKDDTLIQETVPRETKRDFTYFCVIVLH